jgi:hypothetical protein
VLKKVYICKELSDLINEIKSDFINTTIIDCGKVSLPEILKEHQPSLLKSNQLKAFINLQEQDKDKLLELVDHIKVDCIWGFTTLPKNYKLYKKLNLKASIEEVEDLSKPATKRKFIAEKLKEKNLSPELLDNLYLNLSDHKSIAISEINKLSELNKVIGVTKDNLSNFVSTYDSSFDVINFIDSLLNKDLAKSYQYLNKIDKLNYNLVYAVLHKRLMSLLYLSIGNEKQALTYWKYFSFYLNDAKKLSKNIGFNRLLDLINECDIIFSEYTTEISFKLSKLLKLVCLS